jgi:hypothetical protein
MKKLKKVLSLVLVLAMALSVFGVCASATDINDYSDKGEITYTEAVGVLSGLKVLEGSTEDGVSVFKPTKTLSRAEAAAIATRLIGVQDKVVDSTTFTDVEGWAKTYIAIAQSQGLINGRNATTYDPNGTLTGYEWEKIVLCAIGYDAEIEGLVGATWQASTAVLAGKVGLLTGLEADYDATKAITREQAAQIAYNGLKAQTVYYPTTINKIAKFGDKTLGDLVFGLDTDYDNSFDIYGAPEKASITTTKGKVVTEVYSVGYEAVETYNDVAEGTKVSDIIDDLSDATGVKAATVKANLTVYVDGVKADKTTVGGRGVEVAAYVIDKGDEAGTYRIVVKNTYATKITAFTKEDTNSNGTVTTPSYVSGLHSGAQLLAEGYSKGEVIVYNVGNTANTTGVNQNVADNVSIETGVKGYVTTVSGISGKTVNSKSYVKIDSADEKTYFDANATVADNIVKKNPAGTAGYYRYIYDNYDHIIYVDEADRETISEAGHLYLFNTISYYATNATTNTDNLYVDNTDPQAVAQALVVFYEGVSGTAVKAEVINQAITQTADGKFRYLNEYGEADGEKQTVGNNVAAGGTTPVGKFYEYYTTADGEYVLKACDDSYNTVATTKAGTQVTVNGTKKVDATNSTAITVLNVTYASTLPTYDAAHIYEYANAITITPTTYTGFSNFVAASGVGYLETDKSGKATVGAICDSTKTATTTTATAVTAVYTGRESDNVEGGYAYSFMTSDGEPLTVYAAIKTTFDAYPKDVSATDITAYSDASTEFATVGKVYTLYVIGDKVIGYTALTPTNYHAAALEYDGSTGYLKVSSVAAGIQTTDNKVFSSAFKGYAYDATANAKIAIADVLAKDTTAADTGILTGNVVAVYTDANGIAFVSYLGQNYTQATVATVYQNVYTDGHFQAISASDPCYLAVQGAFNAGRYIFDTNPNESAVKLSDVRSIATNGAGAVIGEATNYNNTYVGKTFNITIAKTTVNGATTYTLISAGTTYTPGV